MFLRNITIGLREVVRGRGRSAVSTMGRGALKRAYGDRTDGLSDTRDLVVDRDRQLRERDL